MAGKGVADDQNILSSSLDHHRAALIRKGVRAMTCCISKGAGCVLVELAAMLTRVPFDGH